VSDRPRVLFLTCHLPFPPVSGGRRRDYELLMRLGHRFDIELCVASKTFDEDRANSHRLEPHCAAVSVFPCEAAPQGEHHLPFQVLRHACSSLTAHVAKRLGSGEIEVVHVEGFYLMQHVPQAGGVPVLLVEQNLEYILWRQRTETTLDPHERSRVLQQYAMTLEAEIEAWRRADLCAALTEDDREGMRGAIPGLDVRLVPDGIDHPADLGDGDAASAVPDRVGPVLAFVGNFAYQPNLDAARLLVDVILPKVRARRPDATLWLVGNDPPPELVQRRSESIVVTGRVPSVGPYLNAADVLAYPLRVGGGVKVKVLEALWRGRPVVTTTVGAQGLGADARRAMVVEDDPARFAVAVVRLLNRPRERAVLGAEARRFARTLPTWDEASEALADAYLHLIASRGDRRREKAHHGQTVL